MEHTPEEEERIKAILRYLEGEREVDIYKSLERSKGWVDIKQDAKDGIRTCKKEPKLYQILLCGCRGYPVSYGWAGLQNIGDPFYFRYQTNQLATP